MDNRSDKDRDGTPDVLESIDSILQEINRRFADVVRDRDKVPDSLLNKSKQTASKLGRWDQDRNKIQDLVKQPNLVPQAPNVAQPPPVPTQAVENWFTKLINRLSGKNDQVKAVQREEKETRQRVHEARANVAEAPAELKAAKQEYSRAKLELSEARKKGEDTAKQEAAIHRARARLENAHDRMREAPRTLQAAEAEHAGAKKAVDPTNRVGLKRQAAASIASTLGFDGIANALSDSAQTAQLAARAAAGDPTAIAALAKQKQEKMQEGFRNIGRGVGKTLTSERAGDVLSGAGQTVAGVGGVTGSTTLTVMGKLATVVGDSVEKLRRWNDQLLQSSFRFAEFSGHMAQVQAEQEIRNMRLSRERGDRRAGSTRNLAEAQSRLDRNLAPIEDWWANARSELQAWITNGVSTLVEAIAGPSETTEEQPMTFMEWARESQMSGWTEHYGRPHRFPTNSTIDWMRPQQGRRNP